LKREDRIPRISLNRSVIECELTPSACCVYAESNFRYTHEHLADDFAPDPAVALPLYLHKGRYAVLVQKDMVNGPRRCPDFSSGN